MENIIEIWKPIFDNLYEISNLGRIRSNGKRRKGQILVQYGCNNYTQRYKFAEIHLNGKKKIVRIHRLVAQQFCENPNNYPIVMHLDNNTSNNHFSNLQWGTLKMNGEQRSRDGRCNPPYGTQHPNSKLTEEEVRQIRISYRPRKITLHQLAEKYGVSHGLIFHVIKGGGWKHIV